MARPTADAVEFHRDAGGEPLWFLPQSLTNRNKPLRHCLEELEPDWDGGITWALTGFTGPVGGQFSLWQSDIRHSNCKWATADGISDTDTFDTLRANTTISTGGSPRKGSTTIEITASGTHPVDGLVEDTAYLHLPGRRPHGGSGAFDAAAVCVGRRRCIPLVASPTASGKEDCPK